MHVDGARIDVRGQRPHHLDQMLPTQRATDILKQVQGQVGFALGERDQLLVEDDLPPGMIDAQSAEILSERAASDPSLAPRYGFQTSQQQRARQGLTM